MSPSAVVLKPHPPRQSREPSHALETAWMAWERAVCSAEGRLNPTSGLMRCLSALVPKRGQKESKTTGEGAETSVYILIKENLDTSSPRACSSSVS